MRSSNSCDSSSVLTRLLLMNPSVAYVPITGLDLNTPLGWLVGCSDVRSQSADNCNAHTHTRTQAVSHVFMFMKAEGQEGFTLSEHPKVLGPTRKITLGSLGETEVSAPFRVFISFQFTNEWLCHALACQRSVFFYMRWKIIYLSFQKNKIDK